MRSFFASFDNGDLDSCEVAFAPEAVIHNSGAPDPLSIEAFKQMGEAFLTAFPGGSHTINDILASENKVITRATYRATHTGDLMGIPPTGKSIEVAAMTIDHVENGKIVETWGLYDQFAMMQQLGAIPAQG